MKKSLAIGLTIALSLSQGEVLNQLHIWAKGGHEFWSGLTLLLPVYLVVVLIPLTFFLLWGKVRAAHLAIRLTAMTAVAAVAGAYTGWVNSPVDGMRPDLSGSLILFVLLVLMAWFATVPFMRLGVKKALSADGYAALFDETWRVGITLAAALAFTGALAVLLAIFAAVFGSTGVDWPEKLMSSTHFFYPVGCIAVGIGIAFTDVKPEMIRALRQTLLALMRWLAVPASLIVLAFAGLISVIGVEPLWQTRHAAAGMIAISVALVLIYNTVYQDGTGTGALPALPAGLVRLALIAGPILPALGLWALFLRFRQYGITEDRLYVLGALLILAFCLFGYMLTACIRQSAAIQVRHVNVAATLISITLIAAAHTPLLDLKRIAVEHHLLVPEKTGLAQELQYLRRSTGRWGIERLQEISKSADENFAKRAKLALNQSYGYDMQGEMSFAHVPVFPRGKTISPQLLAHIASQRNQNPWLLGHCTSVREDCAALLIDLNNDGTDEVIFTATHDWPAPVYGNRAGRWVLVGHLRALGHHGAHELFKRIKDGSTSLGAHEPYLGLTSGTQRFAFAPEPGAYGLDPRSAK